METRIAKLQMIPLSKLHQLCYYCSCQIFLSHPFSCTYVLHLITVSFSRLELSITINDIQQLVQSVPYSFSLFMFFDIEISSQYKILGFFFELRWQYLRTTSTITITFPVIFFFFFICKEEILSKTLSILHY